MASAYEKYYEKQPGAVKVIAVAGIALLGYTLYRNWKKNDDLKKANQAANYATNELKELAQQGIYPTLSDSQFEVLAQSLMEAVNGCGTDEDAVFEVFKKFQNEADIRKFIVVFGVRYYQPCAASQPISYSRWLIDDESFGGPLATILSYDLSASDIAYINSILSGKGIEYQF